MRGTPWGWLWVSRGSFVLCGKFCLVVVQAKPQKVEKFHFTSPTFVWLRKNLHVKGHSHRPLALLIHPSIQQSSVKQVRAYYVEIGCFNKSILNWWNIFGFISDWITKRKIPDIDQSILFSDWRTSFPDFQPKLYARLINLIPESNKKRVEKWLLK